MNRIPQNPTSDDLDPASRGPLPFRRVSVYQDAGTPVRLALSDILEGILLCLATLVFLGVVRIPSDVETTALSESNPFNTAVMALLLAVTVPALLLYVRQSAALLVRSPLLILFLAFSIVSISWSDYPDIAARRVVTFVIPLMCALLMVIRRDVESTVIQLGRIILALTLVSTFLAVFVPSIGVMHRVRYADSFVDLTGAWRGITNHKSSLGYIVTLGAQIYGWRLFSESRHRVLHALIVLLMTIVAFKARSSTAIIAIAFTLILLFVLRTRRQRVEIGSALEGFLWVGMLALAILVPILLATFTELVGKDVTLTGRIPLWQELFNYVAQRPWLGFGYGTFWVDGSPNIIRLDQIITWNPPNAHNAYLELALNVGLVGATIGTAFMLLTIFRAYRLARSDGPSWSVYAAVFGIVFAMTNMVDTMLLKSGDFYSFLIIFCHFGLVKYQLEEEARAAPPEHAEKKRRFLPGDLCAAPIGAVRTGIAARVAHSSPSEPEMEPDADSGGSQ
jgi:O-antigen ligase